MEQPTPLAAIAGSLLLERFAPGSPARPAAEALMKALRRDRHRRAAVLAYPDLARQLEEEPVGYERAGQWSGYIPPAFVNLGDDEILRSAEGRGNMLGHRAQGEILNDSPRRSALLELSREAWERRQQARRDRD